MVNDIENCRCGSRNLQVEWFQIRSGMFGSYTYYLEYYVECYDCGNVGESSQAFDSAVRNWNEDCTSTELTI